MPLSKDELKATTAREVLFPLVAAGFKRVSLNMTQLEANAMARNQIANLSDREVFENLYFRQYVWNGQYWSRK